MAYVKNSPGVLPCPDRLAVPIYCTFKDQYIRKSHQLVSVPYTHGSS